MKPIKFITTFSKTGYEVYGKTWIDTFLNNVKDENITADIYVDFKLPNYPKINYIDYNIAIPNHRQWINDFNSKFNGSTYNKKMGVRFSYKSFVMMHALENNPNHYVVWLDGDCIFKSIDDFSSIVNLLDEKAIAVQREDNGGHDHCESGIVIFDTNKIDKFLSQFKNNYQIDAVTNMDSPYDGFIIYKSLVGIDYKDLNAGYGRGGIQSDPNETFLHPEINKRFLHNIGITGKSRYSAWNVYSKTDEYFKLIQSRNRKTPEEIKDIRQKLIKMRRT